MTKSKIFMPIKALAVGAALTLCQQAVASESPDIKAAESGIYTADAGHAYITFSYSHLGYSNPFLRWRNWTAELDWNEDKPSASKVRVEIDASSIDSGVDKFDAHLRSADFFDVANHPKITFVSTDIEETGANTGKLTGNLTVKGETKPVTLDVVFNKAGEDSRRPIYKLGFSARGKVKRTDHGVGRYVPYIGDDVDLIIEVEFDRPKEK